jgi:glycine/D-amino acid oxidase-like deaminating enzyme/nitrite reductase/ring-hydroxylating ferredoxin subunit
MNVEQELSRSVWMEVEPPQLPRLIEEHETEVLVVGAGIAGLSSAYELAQAGRRVSVVDRGRFGRGMTARTTAHLAFEIDDYFRELIKMHGRDRARLWYESQSAAVDRIEAICRAESIDCDFVRLDGYFVPAEDKDVDYLRKEVEAAHEVGFTDAEWIETGAPVTGGSAIRFPRQGRFHPTKYLNGLAAALQQKGARLYQDTDIVALDEADGWITAKTGAGEIIRARQVVAATNTPFHLRIPIHTKQAPYRTYVIALSLPKGAAPDILLWDTVEPGYHYVRLQPGEAEDLLIVGGEDHKSGTEDDGAERTGRLEAWARERWAMAGPVKHRWSGQVFEPADYVPFVGRSPEHQEVYLVTGDSGQGITNGVMSGMLLRDLMSETDMPWAALYAPSRQMHRSLGEYVKENVEAAKHWVEVVVPPKTPELDEVSAGQGALVRMDGKLIAAFRDDAGELHLRSAICTHAGCTVHWNGFERCWDCPCHGSQFSVDGQVLNGPATQPLAAAATDDDHRSTTAKGADESRSAGASHSA